MRHVCHVQPPRRTLATAAAAATASTPAAAPGRCCCCCCCCCCYCCPPGAWSGPGVATHTTAAPPDPPDRLTRLYRPAHRNTADPLLRVACTIHDALCPTALRRAARDQVAIVEVVEATHTRRRSTPQSPWRGVVTTGFERVIFPADGLNSERHGTHGAHGAHCAHGAEEDAVHFVAPSLDPSGRIPRRTVFFLIVYRLPIVGIR